MKIKENTLTFDWLHSHPWTSSSPAHSHVIRSWWPKWWPQWWSLGPKFWPQWWSVWLNDKKQFQHWRCQLLIPMTGVVISCLNNNLVYETVLAISIDCHGGLYHIFQYGGRMRGIFCVGWRRIFSDVSDYGNFGKVNDRDVLIKRLWWQATYCTLSKNSKTR